MQRSILNNQVESVFPVYHLTLTLVSGPKLLFKKAMANSTAMFL